MTSSQHGPDALGDTHATMAGTKGSQPARGSQAHQSRSQFRLQAETRLHEVGVASNRGSAHHGEYVPGRPPGATMFLAISKRPRKTSRTKTKRYRAGLKAKNAARRDRVMSHR